MTKTYKTRLEQYKSIAFLLNIMSFEIIICFVFRDSNFEFASSKR